jgi:hypothetical protein
MYSLMDCLEAGRGAGRVKEHRSVDSTYGMFGELHDVDKDCVGNVASDDLFVPGTRQPRGKDFCECTGVDFCLNWWCFHVMRLSSHNRS